MPGEATGPARVMEKGLWLCSQVLAEARQMGVRAVVAACDSGGNLVAFLRDENAYIASIALARDKAYTSAALQMPTDALESLAAPGGGLYGIQNQERIVIFAGGVPLWEDGALLGGFGVSGGTAQQDKLLARRAAELWDRKDGMVWQ